MQGKKQRTGGAQGTENTQHPVEHAWRITLKIKTKMSSNESTWDSPSGRRERT